MVGYVTFKVDARYVAKVEGETLEELRQKAQDEFADVDFGEAEDIDGEIIIIEDHKGNYIYEK